MDDDYDDDDDTHDTCGSVDLPTNQMCPQLY